MLKELDIQITNKCHLYCKHCCCSSNSDQDLGVPIEKWRKVICDAHRLGVQRIDITGGEPYLRKDMPELLELIQALGIKYEIQSTWITNKNIKDSKNRISAISMDGMRYWHDYYRGLGNFSLAESKLRDLAQLSQSETRVTTVVTNKNKDDLYSLLKLTGSYSVDHHAFFCFSPIGRGKEISSHWSSPYEHIETGEQLSKFITTTNSKLPKKISFQVGYSDPIGKWRDEIGCRAMGKDFLFVLADGRTLPCSWYIDTDVTLGNVFEVGLTRVYNNYLAHIKSMERRSHMSCNACHLFELCKGGCDAARILFNSAVDPRCLDPNLYFPGCPETKVTFHNTRKGD